MGWERVENVTIVSIKNNIFQYALTKFPERLTAEAGNSDEYWTYSV